jgi:hypothetical protein
MKSSRMFTTFWERVAGTLLLIGLAITSKTCGQGFPQDLAGHAMITGEYIGVDSAQAVQLVTQYTNDAVLNSQTVVLCAYGHPVKLPNRDTGVQLDSLVYEPVVDASGPACAETAAGFFILVPPFASYAERAQLLQAAQDVVRQRPAMVFAALIYGTAPVPPAIAQANHWPLVVPRLDAAIFAPPRRTKDT